MLKQQTSNQLQNKLFTLLERYPEEMRDVFMTPEDKTNTRAAAFFATEVARLDKIDDQERIEAIRAYIETIWMAGFEAGRTRDH